MKRLVLAAALSALIAAPALGDLILNGSFEDATFNPGPHATLSPGSTAIDHWTVSTGGNIDYTGTTWEAADGGRSIDLNGTQPEGGIEQEIATTPGTTYLVTFAMAGNPAGLPVVKTMEVLAIGSSVQTSPSFSYDTTGRSIPDDMGWVSKSWTFIADAPSTILQFRSTTADSIYYGPALDDVSVTVVPVPGAVLLGLLGFGAAGLKLRKHV